jgi:4-amino-4-deoxy-L-arabinose transferase-like glycosyltransferase
MPLHVRESHYTLTDVPCTFAVALTFLLALRARERATVGSFALAGAAAGLAAAIKYNGILALVIPLVICAMTPALRKPRPLVALAVVATTVGTFLVAAPYTLLDLPHFLNEFARLSSEYRKAPTIAEPIWVIYLKHLRIALGTPGSVVVVAGLALGVWKSIAGPDRARWLAVWLFPLVYFRFVSNQTIVFARYLLPLVPFLAILGAAAVVAAVALLRRAAAPRVLQYAIVLALVAVSVGPPASAAIAYDANAAKTWTSALAYDWIRHNLPAGTAIRLEGSLAIKLPPIYKVSYVPTLRQNADDFAGAEYLVASSQSYGAFVDNPTGHPEENAAYQRIFAATEEVARFTPTDAHPGPELRILKVPQS